MTAPPPQTRAKQYLDLYRCEVCRRPVEQHALDHGCEWFGLSPLIAWTLVTALEIQGDQWPYDAGDLNVPRCARGLVGDEGFCERMKASAHYLADQLAAGRSDASISRCTADEANLAMALTDVEWIVEESMDATPPALRGASVRGIERDAESATDGLFHDHDVFMLWNPLLDGIENDSETLARMGAAGLQPPEWFEPFNYAKEPIA